MLVMCTLLPYYCPLLLISTIFIFACYCMLLQNLLLQCYYIFLHCYYLLLHQSLLPVITNSLLPVITSLLRHYYVIITSLCNLENSCNNGFIITGCYIGLFRYHIIITHYVIVSHYYLLLTGQLADGEDSRLPVAPCRDNTTRTKEPQEDNEAAAAAN